MSKFKSFAKEPLVHFLILGAGLFVFFQVRGGEEEIAAEQITVTPGRIDNLINAWQLTWQRPPTPAILRRASKAARAIDTGVTACPRITRG